MNIAFDMMGGDFAPLEAVKGLHLYLKNTTQGAQVFCIGNEEQLIPLFAEYNIPLSSVKIVHTTEVIGYHEHPAKAIKLKPDSSIVKGFELLASGQVDAFISAGNTGAMLVSAMFSIKAIDGVQRPTIATTIPKVGGGTGVLLDVGLNVDCKPQHLDQFATLGSLYAQHILESSNPTIGLLNIGEEEGKGDTLAQATYELLKENKQINFYGNVEGRDIFNKGTDVTVCDGFTGNVVLKLAESFYDIVESRNVHTDEFLHRFHYENYGGTPVLGINKPVVIGHGISNDVAFFNMLTMAEKMISTNICEKIRQAFQSHQ